MLQNFRSYHLARELYRRCETIEAKGHVKDQLRRASLSVVLNLSEGSAKPHEKDRRKFYNIAFGSLRETQSILELLEVKEAIAEADKLAAHLYRLTRKR